MIPYYITKYISTHIRNCIFTAHQIPWQADCSKCDFICRLPSSMFIVGAVFPNLDGFSNPKHTPVCISMRHFRSLPTHLCIYAWSVIADLCSKFIELLNFSKVKCIFVIISTSFLCSFCLVPFVCPVSPM